MGPLVLTNAGSYQVVVSDANGSVTSSVAPLFITPTITSQPHSITNTLGQTAAFSVTATNGGAPLNYQWSQNGHNLTDGGTIAGSHNTSAP